MTAGLRVRVHPGAAGTALVGWMADGTLKLEVKPAPEQGRANRAVVELLAHTLGLRPAAVRVVRGASSRAKWIEVDGLDESSLQARITAALAAQGEHGAR
jgi:uncharacterized protein YggU (UPF0235/DUF167 family)